LAISTRQRVLRQKNKSINDFLSEKEKKFTS